MHQCIKIGRETSQRVWLVTVQYQNDIRNYRVSNRKYESMQNQSTAVFPSRSTIGKIETIPQMGMTLKMFAPNAILTSNVSAKIGYVTKITHTIAIMQADR